MCKNGNKKIVPSVLKRGRYVKYIKYYDKLDFIPIETMNKKRVMEFLFFKTTVQRCIILTERDIERLKED